MTANEDENEVRKLLTLSKIPNAATLGDLAIVTKLDLFQAGLSSLPTCLPRYLPNLSILFCMKNKFEEMPEVIGQCKNLQMVSFKSNKLKTIHPDALQSQMRWLILTDNQISFLPSTIGRCVKLQKFMLSGNLLEIIPKEISSCQNLELIRLASNQIKEPPMDLLTLPNLSWVALSDNPFLSSVFEKNQAVGDLNLKVIEDDSLDDASLGIELGKGASGITRQYNMQKGQKVAVKEYFSTITSDGNPQEEKKVSMIASSLGCECLVKVLGQTKKGNLVMEMLQDYHVFANPPSLESCSRDVYEEGFEISEERALGMIETLLYALVKLHENGICHGDFYGHNILLSNSETSGVWLTDFGAAFFYEPDSDYGRAIECAERRAFRHLVDEISASISSISFREKLFEFTHFCQDLQFRQLYQKWTHLKQNIQTTK